MERALAEKVYPILTALKYHSVQNDPESRVKVLG